MACIDFSPALAAPASDCLRQAVIGALHGVLQEPLLVDTVFDAAENPACSCSNKFYLWYLLLDVHRVFLYRRGKEYIGANSIARLIIDDYQSEHYKELKQHFQCHGFKNVHDLRRLEVFRVIYTLVNCNSVVTLDFISGDIRFSEGRLHAEVAESVNWPSLDPSKKLKLSRCVVGQNLRHPGSDPPTALESVPSPDLGLIRGERLIIHSSSLPVSVNRLGFRQGLSMMCSGKATKPSQAIQVARCEALERYQTMFQSPTCLLTYGSRQDLQDKTVDPRLLFFDTVRRKPEDKRVEYTDRLPIYWAWADGLVNSERRLVPAQEVWFNTDRFKDEHICITNTTNACAVGQCLEEAALFALFEAIERDAFLTTWYLRRTCGQITASSVRFEPFQLLWARLRVRFPNYRFHFFDIRSDIIVPSVVAIAVRNSGTGPKMLLTAATHLLAERAMFSALKDLGVSLSSHVQGYQDGGSEHFFLHPQDVANPDDHRALYSLDQSFARLSFLGFDAPPRLTCEDVNHHSWFAKQESFDLKDVLECLSERLNGLDVQVLLKDISHPEMAAAGLRCVKATGIGLYPMWFGYYGIRFAITPRLKKLAAQWGAPILNESDINLELHPFD
jgi:ribosomal protein S12 methylthiotransferase accessory factor